ncbi:hypothetical protein L208DRAFT_919010 [Tricholoma matsutake]|nr:hypothetical protein L208DRAFT_919010 [Tricholoma matsutake 945]
MLTNDCDHCFICMESKGQKVCDLSLSWCKVTLSLTIFWMSMHPQYVCDNSQCLCEVTLTILGCLCILSLCVIILNACVKSL